MNRLRLSPLIAIVRDADFMHARRTRAYGIILAVLSVAGLALWIGLSSGGLDADGKPLGTDFLSFYAAGTLAADGQPAAAYDVTRHKAAEDAIFPGSRAGYFAFFYPPPFLLVVAPLALLPYFPALAAWLLVTGLAYLRVVASYLGRTKGALLPVLAFPAVFTNIGHGQNGFLTASLFGGGMALLRRRPLVAGALLGLLVIKPHLALPVPVALAVVGHWRALASAAVTAAAAIALATLVFGIDIWPPFLAASALARATLEQGLVDPAKMQSAFAAIRLWHGGLGLAYGVQAAVALAAVAAMVAILLARRLDACGEGAVVALAALLASPFLLDYDLTLLALPLAWLFAEGLREGFLPWEKAVLMAGFVLPLVSRQVATLSGIPLAPLVLALLFGAIWTRTRLYGASAVAISARAARPSS